MTRMRYVTYSADRPPTGGRPTAPPCSASVTAHLGPPGEDFLYSFKAAPSGRRSRPVSMQPQAPHGACGLRPVPARRTAAPGPGDTTLRSAH
jgi:hypothetical protein